MFSFRKWNTCCGATSTMENHKILLWGEWCVLRSVQLKTKTNSNIIFGGVTTKYKNKFKHIQIEIQI